MIRAPLLLALCAFPALALAAPPPVGGASPGESTLDDVVETFALTGRGFLAQFSEPAPLATLVVGLFAVTWTWTRDTPVQRAIEDADVLGDAGETASDYLGLALSLPVVTFGAYGYGRATDDKRMMRFAIEMQATMLLTQIESSLISQLGFHERPTVARGDEADEEQSFFDATFRGRSSFPSGHMIGPLALALHGFDTYGWTVGAPATALAVFVAVGRIQEGRHFPTDIVGAAALTTSAFLAVRAARRWLPDGDGAVVVAPYATADAGGIALLGVF